MGLTKLNSIHVSSSPVMGWVELDFFNTPCWDGLKKALNLTQLIHTPLIVGVHV